MTADRDPTPTEAGTPDELDYDDYFQDLSDGCGCTELWEYMSDRRRRN